MRKDVALYLLLILAFASLLIDVRYEHRDVLNEQWTSWIPLVASVVAIAASLLAFSKGPGHLRMAAVLFVLVGLVGFGGVYFHTRLRAYMFTRYVVPVDAGRGPDGRPKLRGLQRPTFAPLAFTGLGLMGFILVWPGFRWPDRSESPAAGNLPGTNR